MTLEKRGFWGPMDIDLQKELKKLSTNGEVAYLGDLKDDRMLKQVYHMNNTTLIANIHYVSITGEFLETENTRKNIEEKLKIKLELDRLKK